MLQKLCIKNVALIEGAEINFTQGLNVLSGETGSGKSVIIDSLNFVLGAKADKSIIRSGQQECFVKAEFDVSLNQRVFDVLSEFDFENEDLLIVSRKFTIDGKSSIKINGNTATLGMLKKLTSILVDVHGQSEHFNLLKTVNQLDLIDKIGGEVVAELKTSVKQRYNNYKETLNKIQELGGSESERLMRLDVLTYQINEIEGAAIRDDEEETLLVIRQKLQHQEKITTALNTLKSAIDQEGGVSDILANVSRLINSISTFDEEYSNLYERLENVFSEIDDLSNSATALVDAIDFSDINPYEIESRLDLIKALKSKYGGSVQAIFDFCQKAKEEKEKLENYNQLFVELEKQIDSDKNELYDVYQQLSDKRRSFAKTFIENVLVELKELGMPKATFDVCFSSFPELNQCDFDSANGIDKVEFYFSANAGEPLKPLSNVISGGEMSRFMLSIKVNTSKHNDIDTFIFDEIDAGISGGVAKVVAEKFAKIAKNTQIIAITHLPQISAMADNNLFINKIESLGKTTTTVKTLSDKDKVDEIVRLVGGDNQSVSAVQHAKELIDKANKFKKSLN